MKKTCWFTIAMAFAVLTSILFTSFASARPQAYTYSVNSWASDPDINPGDGVCNTMGGVCTLYAAIDEANADGVTSTINFAQKFQGSSDDIYGCVLPAITADYTTIDASSQWDTAYDRPGVEINGLGCALLSIYANNTTILGLLFGASNNAGVYINGNLNIIGGYNSGQRNVFISGVVGVDIGGGISNAVSNNYFGTIDGVTLTGSGTNGIGILVMGGDYTTLADNLIVGQSGYGIQLESSNNFVRNNIIGMSWNQANTLPNTTGIVVWKGSNNTIGPGNVIAGNTSHGLYFKFADNNQVSSNSIGSYTGVGNGGDGIYLHVSDNIQITDGNSISYNTGNGVYAIGSSDITIQGSTIDSNKQVGIYFDGINNSQIGSAIPGERNTIGRNESHGIWLETSTAITVTANYIGLNQGAFDWGNLGYGILVDNGSTDITIGGTKLGEANWIGWNYLDGIRLDGNSTHHNYVVGNVIGAPINWGFETPNYNHGVSIYNGAYDNYIGWDGLPNGGNVILASGWSGVAIVGSNDNAVLANRIGTNGLDKHWGNAYYGITVSGSGNSIKGNEIAYNGTNGGLDKAQAGVLVDGAGSINNLISSDSIHDNDGPGIQLANNANHNLVAPHITSASCEQVQGTACANCLIEIYSDSDNEGQRKEGHFTTTPSGNFTWIGAPFGPNITALAIGPGSSNDTSPFSAPFHVGRCISLKIFLPMLIK